MEDPNARLTELLSQASMQLYERNWPELHQLFEQMYLLAADEERQKQRDVQALLAADTAVQDSQWQWGRQLYQLVLNHVSGHRGASNGLREIKELERVDEEMRRLIEAGDSAFAAGDYNQAIDRYKDAKNQTEKARILKYHASLEQKINRALELRNWQERVQETIASAKRLQKRGELTQALAELQHLQAEMLEEPLYADLAQEINALVNQIKQEASADDVLSKAIELYDAEDFASALGWVEDNPTLADNEKAKQLIQRCRRQLGRIDPKIDNAEKAMLRGNWPDAFAYLQELRNEFPRNPNWRGLWLRVGRKAGEQALDLGRQANSNREFQEATAAFKRASQAFERVLEVYPDHDAIPALRDEAVDLAYIADNEHQAWNLWRDKGERKAALTHLDNASGRISSAREQGRDYAAVTSVVEAMVKDIRGQLEIIAEDERRLENGERQLGNRQFDSAAESFRQALNAELPEHRQSARGGLDRAEAAIRDFQAAISHAKASADLEARVRHLEDAYRVWPTGPQAVELLTTACLEAAEAALKDGRAQDATTFANRALELDPKNRTAVAIRDRIDDEPKILAGLARERSELNLLRGAADASAERYAALASQLQETANQARPYPDLKKQADALLKEVRAEQARWQQLENHLVQATQSMRAGRWQEGVDLLDRGVKALGDEVPEPLAVRLQAWQRALQQQTEIEAQLVDLWRQTEQNYQSGPESGDFTAALKTLTQIEAHLSAIQNTAGAIESALPAGLVERERQSKDLRERAEIAREAAVHRSAAQGLLILRPARRKWPTDTTLQALDAKLSEQARDEVTSLLRQAKLDMDAGEIAMAVEKLAQAYELQPDNEEIATQYAAVQKRKRLEDKLRDVQTLVAAKLDDKSRVAAADALRSGLEILRIEADLSDEARGMLGSLLSLREERKGEAFAYDDLWLDAKTIGQELDKLTGLGWSYAQTSLLANQWVRLTREQHLYGHQSTQAAMGQFLQSWLSAREFMSLNPTDEQAIATHALRLTQLIEQCEAAAARRIANAKRFRDQGTFDLARSEIASMQALIQSVLEAADPKILIAKEGESPRDLYEVAHSFFKAHTADAFKTDDQKPKEGIVQQLDDAKELKQEIDAQANVAEKAMPLLEEAEAAYVAGSFEESSRNLRALPDLVSVPRLAAQRDDLQRRLHQARVTQADKTLSDALLVATTDLGIAASVEELDRIASELRAMGEARKFDWSILPGDARSRYDELLRQIEKRKGDFASVVRYQREAEKKEQMGQFDQARRLLEDAKELTADAGEQAEIDLRLLDITRLAQIEADAHELHDKGERELAQADPSYQNVLTWLGEAQNLFNRLQREIKRSLQDEQAASASNAVRKTEERIAALIDLAHAGDALSRAEQPDAWSTAHYKFEDAIELALEAGKSSDGNVKAKAGIIERRARRLKEQMDQEQTTRARLQVELDAVQAWLAAGNLVDAGKKLNELTEQYKAGFSAQIDPVKARYLETLSAAEQTKKARAEMEAGNFSTARAIVNIVLERVPGFEGALILKQQIVDREGANQQFQNALSFAKKEKFQEARDTLQAMDSGIDEGPRKMVEDQVDVLELAAKNRAVESIRPNMKMGEYRKALEECAKALDKLASPGYKKEIEDLQAEAIEKWINTELRDRARNDTGQRLDDLLKTLDLYTKHTPPIGETQRRALLGLQREAQTRLFRAQLAEARSLVESAPPNWHEARRLVSRVIEESGTLDLGGVEKDAVSLEYEIDDLERTWNKTKTQSKRDGLIAEAQQRWNSAAGPEDYQAVQGLAQQVLALDGFKTDREARKWQQEATRELEAYQRTEQSLTEASHLVRQRRFVEARSALQIDPVAVLLHEQHQRQRQIVDTLIDADRAELDGGEWQVALEGYRSVLEMDRSLEAVLRVDIDRCRSKLMDTVSEQVQTALTAVPPNIQRAAQLLDQAEASDLVGDADRQVVRRLRTRISGLTQVAQAAAILAEPSGDAGEALRLLAAARDILPADEADRLVRDWEYLARALQSWQLGDISAAQRAVKAIQPPVSTLERVTQLAGDLDEAIRRSQQIEQARRQVLAALRQDPPAFAEAVALVAPVAREMQDARVAELHAAVRRSLLEQVEHERQRDNYQAALDLQPLLEQLDPAGQDMRSLAETLSAEREQRLQETIDNALAALESNDLAQARHAYQRATVIAAPAGDTRLAPVVQRISGYEELMQRIGELLASVAQARRGGRWEEVVSLLEQARDIAPRQKQVQEGCQDTQRQLTDLAEDDLRASRFEGAAARVALASRLGATPELQTLAERIESARQAHVGQRRELWSAALDRWDLASAEMLAAELQDAIGGDVKLKQLRDRYLSMKAASKDIVQAMRSGWAALDRRDFLQARSAFEQADSLVNPSGFAEATAWLSYTANLAAVQEPVTEGRWGDIRRVQEALQRARASVATSDAATLPAILPESGAKRQKAAGVAAELDRILSQIAQWYKRYQDFAKDVKTSDALDALNQVDHFQQEFLRQLRDPSPPKIVSAARVAEQPAARPAGRSDARTVPPTSTERDQVQDAAKPQAESADAAGMPDVGVQRVTSDEAPAEERKGADGAGPRASKPPTRLADEAPPSQVAERTTPAITTDEESTSVAPPKKRTTAPEPAAHATDAPDGTTGEAAEEQVSSDPVAEDSDTGFTMVWDITGFSLPSYDNKE